MSTIEPSTARREAIGLLSAVLENKRTLDEAAANLPLAGDSADARFVMTLALTTLRHLGQIDTLLAHYVEKPLPPKRAFVRNALRIGITQLRLLDTPAHAAVNETVEAVKRSKDKALAGFVNAVMHRISREKRALPEPLHNIPAWLRARWEGWYGAETVKAIAEIASTRPPLDLNLPAPASLAEGERLDEFIWRLPADHAPVPSLSGYAEGTFFVQDVAASYPVRLLGDVRGKQVLDLAAAPGGKTAQLLRAGATVTALDRAPSRLQLLKENLERLKLHAEFVTADLLEWQAPTSYDAILLDAPCSATGTWRKHPEVLALTGVTDVIELARLQRQMLTRAWHWLKPGGKLVYCVCSLEREEGEDHVAWFLETCSDAKLQPATGIPGEYVRDGILRTLPHCLAERGGMDGFFAAAFTKV